MSARASTGSRRNPATHKAIIEAACAVLQDTGDITFEEVARRSGAGKTTIYRWWPHKADLFIEVYRRQFKSDDFVVDSGDLKTDIRYLFRKILVSWRNTPSGQAIRCLLTELHKKFPSPEAKMRNFMPEQRDSFRAVLERGRKRGQLRANVDLEMSLDMLMGLSCHCLLFDRFDPHDSDIAGFFDILFHGICAA
jgi:AcrR family transcriptional regulator